MTSVGNAGPRRVHDGPMENDQPRTRWLDRVLSPGFWMIALAILFFLAVFVVVLID